MCMSSFVVCAKCRRSGTARISRQTFTSPPRALVIYIFLLSTTSDHGYEFYVFGQDVSENLNLLNAFMNILSSVFVFRIDY